MKQCDKKRPNVGDLIRFNWRKEELLGTVVEVYPGPGFSGIDFSMIILGPNSKKYIYDVFQNNEFQFEVISLYETR